VVSIEVAGRAEFAYRVGSLGHQRVRDIERPTAKEQNPAVPQ
jgi:hypothetical protein